MGKFNKGASTNFLHMVSDCFFMIIAFLLATMIAGISLGESVRIYAPIVVVFMLIFVLVNKDARIYNVTTFFYTDRVISYVTKSFLIATGVTALIIWCYADDNESDAVFYTAFVIVTHILMLSSAFLIRYLMKNVKVNATRVLLVGDIDRFEKFKKFLGKSNMDVNIVGFVSMENEPDERYIGHISELEQIVHEQGIGEVYIMHRKTDLLDLQQYIDICMDMGVTVRIIMNTFKARNAQSYVSSIGTYPLIIYHRVCLNSSAKVAKRVIDIIGSLVGIIVFSPIMLVTAIAIKLDSKGPVIFKQERVGLNGQHFKMYKFRSMCVNAEELKAKLMDQNEVEGGLMFKMKDDPRITKVGKFIRKTSIDELPQFFNVLIGNMSLVGTRPPTMDEVALYNRVHWRRMSIKPGITGMWQVSGRSEIKDFDEIVELDTTYIDKWSIWFDFKIMFMTVICLVRRKGAY